MSDSLQELDDGHLFNCCGTFVSKRVLPVAEERVVVFTMRICGYLIPFVLGPGHTGDAFGWRIGDVIEIRSVLMCETTSRQLSVGDCPSFGDDVTRPSAVSLAPISQDVASTLHKVPAKRFLLAIPGTVPLEATTTDLDYQPQNQAKPDWLRTPDAECETCGRTLESDNETL